MSAALVGADAHARSAKPVYTRVEAAGLLLAAAGPAVMLVLGLVTGMSIGEDLPFFAVAITVPLVAAALVWRFGRWSKVVGILAALLVALALFWTVFGLAYPRSLGDFVPGVLVPLGVALALGGGVAALLATRRGDLATAATRAERRILNVALLVVAIAMLGSGAANLVGRSVATEVGGAVPVSIRDFAFAEGTYTLPAGQTATMRVHNADAFTHTFTVPALGIDEVLLPGASANIEVSADAGTYTLYCKPHANTDEPDPQQAGMAAAIVAQ
jgi:plastocyanin